MTRGDCDAALREFLATSRPDVDRSMVCDHADRATRAKMRALANAWVEGAFVCGYTAALEAMNPSMVKANENTRRALEAGERSRALCQRMVGDLADARAELAHERAAHALALRALRVRAAPWWLRLWRWMRG